MTRQLTVFEIIRLLFSLLVSAIVYIIAGAFGSALSGDDPGWMGLLSYLFLGIFVPAFLAVLVAPIFPSWRYKLITATLVLNAVTILALFDVFSSLVPFIGLVVALIRLSTAMTGALVAILIWRAVKTGWTKRAKVVPFTGQPAEKMPKTSPILLGLSLLSIPITYITIFASAFLVLGYSALLILLLLELPRIPVIIIIAAFLAPIVAIWVSMRALGSQFFAKPAFQPARTLPLAQRPQLNQMVKEVCAAVGTQEPDNVILHIQPTFFVTQQKIKTFDSEIKGRTLAMGMPLLPLLSNQELKSVLAHEFAHFSGSDTLYSTWVAPVYRSLGESITRLQQTTSSAGNRTQFLINLLLIPSLMFLIVFYEYFASIDSIISRSREFRADWVASTHYGSNAFVSALKKIVQYSTVFAKQQEQNRLDNEGDFQHHYRILDPVDPSALQQYLDEAMAVQEREFDSHPTLPARIGSVPTREMANDEGNEVIQQELSADEAALSASYTETLNKIKEFYLQHQKGVTS